MIRPLLIIAALLLAACPLLFFIGRWTAPPKYAYEPAVPTPGPAITKTTHIEHVVTKIHRVTTVAQTDAGTVTTTDTTTDAPIVVPPAAPPPAPIAAAYAPALWHASIGVGLTFDRDHSMLYSASIERHVIGPFWAGAEITSQPAGFLKVGASF